MNKNRMVVGIESDPPKAKVYVDGGKEHICVTPCEYKLETKGLHNLEMRWGANPPQSVSVKRTMHPGFWFNFFFGPGVLIGMPVDMLTSSVFRPNYKGIFIQFDPTLKGEEEEEPEVIPSGYQRLPDTAELRRVKEQFPEEYMRDQVELYYGTLENEVSYFKMIDRLYLIMINMYRDDDRLDIDEAVRRDYFMNPRPVKEQQ